MSEATTRQRDELVEELVGAARGTFTTLTVYFGDALGFYRALADAESLTPAELAARTDTHERYVREWCEQQTVAGILVVDDPTVQAEERRYALPRGHVEPLTDEESPHFVVPLAQLLAGAVRPLDDVLEAFHTGGGVPYEAYGAVFREGQARMNRPAFLDDLPGEWLPAMPDVEERLRAGGRVADVGCGHGWSCIGIARTYPDTDVDGFDIDAASVEAARENVAAAGLDDRVTVHHRDASEAIGGDYDLVAAFECVHDLPDPVGVLSTMRDLTASDGTVLVVDERVGEQFTPEGTAFEWMMYGWSVLHCLPVGMAKQPSAATGTVMRTDTLREYAEAAGFSGVEVLPVEDEFFRLYRLDP